MSGALFIICISTVFAALVQASTGFGMVVVLMAIWPFYLSILECTMLLQPTSALVVAIMFVRYFKDINYKLVIWPTLFSFLGITLGLTFLINFDDRLMIKVLGVVLICLAIYFFIFSSKANLTANFLTSTVAGVVAGVLSGLTNTPGPAMALYYTAATKHKNEYMGTIQAYMLFTILFKLLLFWTLAEVRREVFVYLPWTMLSALLGTALGTFLFRLLPIRVVRKSVYSIMLLSGLLYLVK
jgi:uncharacterized membrane protein YfcA